MINPLKKEELEKELFMIHIKDKNIGKRTITVVKKHAYITIAVVGLFLAGSLYSYSRYRINTEILEATAIQLEHVNSSLDSVTSSKEALEEKSKALESENETYNKELAELEKKAETIQQKIEELEKVKSDLYNKLEDVSKIENENDVEIASQTHSPSVLADDTAKQMKFENVVITPFTSSNTKTAFLTSTLSRLENDIEGEELAFVDVSENVTETLAYIKSVPTIWPVNGNVSSEFSFRVDPINSSNAFHQGLDIRASIGTPVKATASGRVIKAEFNNSGYGNMVVIDHGNGYTTLYAHNSSLNVATGDKVEQGDIIALSGATGRVTGPHVHYEVELNGELQNPRDLIK